jgi:hypothetical protein
MEWKKYIHHLPKIFLGLVAVFLIVILASFAWIATGKREISWYAPTLAKRIAAHTPGYNIDIQKLYISFDGNRDEILLTAEKIAATNQADFDLTLKAVNAYINLIGLLPYNDDYVVDLSIDSTELETINQLSNLNTEKQRKKINLVEIQDIFKEYEYIFSKLKFSLSNVPLKWGNQGVVSDVFIKRLSLGILHDDGHIKLNSSIFLDINEQELEINGTASAADSDSVLISLSASRLSPESLKLLPNWSNVAHIINLSADAKFHGSINLSGEIEAGELLLTDIAGTLLANEYFAQEIEVQNSSVKLVCTDNCKTFTAPKFLLHSKDFILRGNASYDGTLINASVVAEQLDQDDLKKFWPNNLIIPTRTFVLSHIPKVNIKNLTASVRYDLEKGIINEDDINVKMGLSDTTLSYTSPAIEGIDALVSISKKNVIVDIDKARVSDSELSQVKLEIRDMDTEARNLMVEARITGPIQDAVDLAFSYVEGKNDTFTEMSGDSEAFISLNIPLDKNNTNKPDIKVKAKATKLVKQKLFDEYDISEGDITAAYDNGTLALEGSAVTNALLPLEFKYVMMQNRDFNYMVEVNATNNVEAFRQSRLPAVDSITGEVEAKFKLIKFTDGRVKQSIALDVTKADIKMPEYGIFKTAEEPGKISFDFEKHDQLFYANNYDIDIPNLTSQGDMVLEGDKVIALKSDSVRLGKGQFSIDYKNNNGKIETNIAGQAIDLSKLDMFDFWQKSNIGSSGKTSLNIRMKVDNLYGKDGVNIADPALRIDCPEEMCKEIALFGRFDDDKKIGVDFKYPRLKAYSADAGALLRAFGVYDNMHEGIMYIDASYDKKGIMRGVMSVDSFFIKNTPILANILRLSAATYNPFVSIIDILQGKGVRFKRMKMNFHYKNGSLATKDFYMTGPVMVVTSAGMVSLRKNIVDLEGVITPRNIINSLIKVVPVIGPALSGGDKKGLIATRYALKGDLDEQMKPKVNPLSVLNSNTLKDIQQMETPNGQDNTKASPQTEPEPSPVVEVK